MQKFILVLDGAVVKLVEGDVNTMHEDILNNHKKQIGRDVIVLGGGFKEGNLLFSTSQQYGTPDYKNPYIQNFMHTNFFVYATTGRYGKDDIKFIRPLIRTSLRL